MTSPVLTLQCWLGGIGHTICKRIDARRWCGCDCHGKGER